MKEHHQDEFDNEIDLKQGFGDYKSRSPYNPEDKQRYYPMILHMLMNSWVKDPL